MFSIKKVNRVSLGLLVSFGCLTLHRMLKMERNGYTQAPQFEADVPGEKVNGLKENDEAKPKIKAREQWTRKIDFFIACCGFSIGLGNVWRFPFLCYRNGGGAFLIPYFTSVILGGIPVFFLEVSLGQFMSQGGTGAWKICPLFQGLGIASAVIVFLVNCDYNVLLTWSFYYLFASFTTSLPWSTCNNDWNTVDCSKGHRRAGTVTISKENSSIFSSINYTTSGWTNMLNETKINVTSGYTLSNITGKKFVSDPVTEFWERKVLHLSEGVHQPGIIHWDLCLCLLLAWIVVYFCIWKGIKSSGKVMYFTVATPYILMFVLLIRGLTLEGAAEGIKFYLIPDFSKLKEVQVWADAGNQIFYSYSLTLGTLAALGSYNKFHHNSYRDCFLFAMANSLTSLLAGFVIFSVLGFMAVKQNVSVADVAESGPGLAFIAYPEAVAQMPVAPLWSALFFAMLILLGLDSQFVGVEGLITFVVDLNPNVFRKGHRREILIAVVCVISFLIGLSMVCEGGMYVFQLFDYFSVSRTIFIIAFFECVVIAYVYGVNRYYDCLELMYGFRILPIMKICWMFITPVFIMGLFVSGVITYSSLKYERKSVTYAFPPWAIMIGWIMAAASITWIPINMVYKICNSRGSLMQRLRSSIKPVLKKHQLIPGEDLSKVTLEDDYCDDNTQTQLQSTFINGKC